MIASCVIGWAFCYVFVNIRRYFTMTGTLLKGPLVTVDIDFLVSWTLCTEESSANTEPVYTCPGL